MSSWPRCECCKQSIRSDPDLAYNMFLCAKLYWDNKEISHDTLRDIFLGLSESKAVNSNGSLKYPGEYGVDPVREWMRRELGGSIVIIDADYAVRRYGKRFNLSADGDLMLIEKKERWPIR
jgi:hypothetical protein